MCLFFSFQFMNITPHIRHFLRNVFSLSWRFHLLLASSCKLLFLLFQIIYSCRQIKISPSPVIIIRCIFPNSLDASFRLTSSVPQPSEHHKFVDSNHPRASEDLHLSHRQFFWHLPDRQVSFSPYRSKFLDRRNSLSPDSNFISPQ